MENRTKAIYYPELDSLRFLAFLAVFIHHSPPLTKVPYWEYLYQYGWMGVDLFLCLSAFLFTRLLFTEHQATGKISIWNFYVRRSLRIWPLYFMFFGLVFAYTLFTSNWEAGETYRMLGILTFTDNVFSAFKGVYNPFIVSAHLWTISYEEQFYALIPWTLRKLFVASQQAKVRFIVIVFLVGQILRAVLLAVGTGYMAIWVLPITHFESILGGLIIGMGLFDEQLKKIPNFLILLAGLLALVGLCSLPNIYVEGWHLPLSYTLVGLGMTLIVHAVMNQRQSFVKTLFQNKIFTYLGKISYGLYVYSALGLLLGAQAVTRLLHIPKNAAFYYPLSVMTISLFITILLSILSYQLVEKNFLRLKKRFTVIESRPI
jgi:peptidoglycan/LPS O-acetylase OafA/YrhL